MQKVKMRLPYKRSGLRTYFILIGILSLCSTPKWIIAGLPVFFIGLMLRIWAKGCLHQMQEVTRTGPYSFIRHPFYLGNFFLDMSICIMSGFVPLVISGPFLWLAVYIPKMKEEEKKMTEKFGKAYENYKRDVSMIVPSLKIDFYKDGFSWKNPNILKTELPRSFRFLCYPLIFIAVYLIKNHRLQCIFSKLALILSSVFCFYSISFELKNIFKKGKSFFGLLNPEYLLLIAIFSGFFIRRFEFEYDLIIWPLGTCLLLFSFFMKNRILSDWFKASGFLIMFEIPWLILILSPLYVSLLVKKDNFSFQKIFDYTILTVGISLAILKEILG